MRPHVSGAPDILRRVQHSFCQSLKEREKKFPSKRKSKYASDSFLNILYQPGP